MQLPSIDRPWAIVQGNALDILRNTPPDIFQTCITSPPYWGLRDYGLTPTWWPEVTYHPMPGLPPLTVPPWTGCLGLEPTPEMFTAHIILIYREIWRVLRDDGTAWLNIGDCYAARPHGNGQTFDPKWKYGIKHKNLLGIPWRLFFALQADGWYMRSDCIWEKPNGLPEAVQDRCTRNHEYLFLMSKRESYFYDKDAIREPLLYPEASQPDDLARAMTRRRKAQPNPRQSARDPKTETLQGRNKRTVWMVPLKPVDWAYCTACNRFYKGTDRKLIRKIKTVIDGQETIVEKCLCGRADAWAAHYAAYPPELIEPCILSSTSPYACPKCGAPWKRVIEKTGHINQREPARVPNNNPSKADSTGWAPTTRPTDKFQPTCNCPDNDGSGICFILDPFSGSGTTIMIAVKHGRGGMGIDQNPDYIRIARHRIQEDQPLFNYVTN